MRGTAARWLIGFVALTTVAWSRLGLGLTMTSTPTRTPTACATGTPCEPGVSMQCLPGSVPGDSCRCSCVTVTPTRTETPTPCALSTPCGPGMQEHCPPGASGDSCRCWCQQLTPTPSPTGTACATGTPCGSDMSMQCLPGSVPGDSCRCACVTFTPTPTATPSASVVRCVGDCDSGGQVTLDEIMLMVDIALDAAPAADCEAGDANGDEQISVDEILGAVNNALNACPTPVGTVTPTATTTWTATSGGDCATTACPDLDPVSASMYWPPPASGCIPPGVLYSNYYLDVCVRNSGSVAAGTFQVALDASAHFVVTGLAAGETACTRIRDYPYYQQRHLTVDSFDEVAETNETNNQLSFSVPVPSLPPVCATATATPTPPSGAPTPTATEAPTPSPT